MSAAPALVLKNTLESCVGKHFLFVSAWMRDPNEMHTYYDFHFREVDPLECPPNVCPTPIPVRVDPATMEFLRSRRVTYLWKPYHHKESDTQRVKITALRVEPVAALGANEPAPISDELPVFLERFLNAHRKPDEVIAQWKPP